MKRLLAIAIGLSAGCFLPATASAQDEGGDRVNTLIIYGDDECPPSTGDEITVCARMDEGERYRIPERLRQSEDPANEAWASRVEAYEAVGNFGPLSCTPVGAGGEFGCNPQFIEAAYAERAQSSDVRFSQLIEEARQERLSTIDDEAAETQARVEEVEREYMERERQRQAGEAAPPETSSEPEPVDTTLLPPVP